MTTDPLIGYQTNELRFDRLIGRGAMGAVYQGVQLSLGRTVAIKVIAPHLADDADHRTRFDREARTLGRLVHPNIIACHDVGPCPGPDGRELFVMVLEFVDGWNLGALLKRDQLTVRRVLDLHRQAAEGLAYAHGEGIIHRDIKPDNIMVTRTGQAKVADFGLAKAEDSTLVTHTGVILGSPAYMSPEACQGQALTPESDLYGLGCSLFHCLSGSPPFPAASSLQVLNLHVNAPIPLLSSRRPDLAVLDQVLAKLLSKDPKARYENGNILARDLKEIITLVPGRSQAGHGQASSMVNGATVLSGGPAASFPPTANPATASPTATLATSMTPLARRRWPYIAAALVMALVALLVIDTVRNRDRDDGAQRGAIKAEMKAYNDVLKDAQQSLVDNNLEQADIFINHTFKDENWPQALRGTVADVRAQLDARWEARQRRIQSDILELRRLIDAKNKDEAKSLALTLQEMCTPHRFSGLRQEVEKEIQRLQGSGSTLPRLTPLTDPLMGLGQRYDAGFGKTPMLIPGNCQYLIASSPDKSFQRIAFPLNEVAAGDGIALVVYSHTERELRVKAVGSGISRELAKGRMLDNHWHILSLPFKTDAHMDRLELEADGDSRPGYLTDQRSVFLVGRVVLGSGGTPKEADLGVAAGTLRLSPMDWNATLRWSYFLQKREVAPERNAERVYLGVVSDQPLDESHHQLLGKIDATFNLESSDHLKTVGRVVQLNPKTDPKSWVKPGMQVLFLLLPPFKSKEEAESSGRTLTTLFPSFRAQGVLPVPIVRSAPGASASFSDNFYDHVNVPGPPGDSASIPVPVIDLDQVAPFLNRSHLLGADGKADAVQTRAGLLAGVAELKLRLRRLAMGIPPRDEQPQRPDQPRPLLRRLEKIEERRNPKP